ncbi:hypothetical protein MMS54_28800, partial [Escherichia coli]|nr:hypothetical protein [Escherichia coli]
MAVAASARNALKTPLAAKPLPDAKKCVTKPLSAFLRCVQLRDYGKCLPLLPALVAIKINRRNRVSQQLHFFR